MKPLIACLSFLLSATVSQAQAVWKNVDSLYGPLPTSVHIYYTDQPIDTGKFRAYYLIADLKDRNLEFTTDTTDGRRLSPSGFYQKNSQPVVVVNGTFFSFQTNRNLNVVIRKGRVLAFNQQKLSTKRGDTVVEHTVYPSAIGIRKNRKADVAWVKTDSPWIKAKAVQDLGLVRGNWQARKAGAVVTTGTDAFEPWKMETAIGGGPVLLQEGAIRITNDEEHKFGGKGIRDKHPRTAMGYTADGKLVILVVEGRSAYSGGATLIQEAQLLKDLGCVEALNLDGGGSSCLLVNGKETIKPSDKEGQRAVPAVFLIRSKN